MAFKSYFEAKVLGGLLELEEYLEITEKYLQKAATDFETWVDEQEKNLSGKEREEFDEFMLIFMNSMLMIIGTMLRHFLQFFVAPFLCLLTLCLKIRCQSSADALRKSSRYQLVGLI
jgi:hypothetical protein